MKDPQSDRSQNQIGMIAGVAVLVAAVAGGATWWMMSSKSDRPVPDVSPTPTESPITVETTVEIYWVGGETQIEFIPTPVALEVGSDRPEAVLTAAFERLLTGSPQPDRFSEIPPGTQLLNLTTTPDGAIVVDLSPEFTQGGGSASMIGRLGQIVYTATSLNPDAPVRISVNGEPLNVLGGEGLEVPQPVTRQQFEREFLQVSFNRPHADPPPFTLGKSVTIRIET